MQWNRREYSSGRDADPKRALALGMILPIFPSKIVELIIELKQYSNKSSGVYYTSNNAAMGHLRNWLMIVMLHQLWHAKAHLIPVAWIITAVEQIWSLTISALASGFWLVPRLLLLLLPPLLLLLLLLVSAYRAYRIHNTLTQNIILSYLAWSSSSSYSYFCRGSLMIASFI